MSGGIYESIFQSFWCQLKENGKEVMREIGLKIMHEDPQNPHFPNSQSDDPSFAFGCSLIGRVGVPMGWGWWGHWVMEGGSGILRVSRNQKFQQRKVNVVGKGYIAQEKGWGFEALGLQTLWVYVRELIRPLLHFLDYNKQQQWKTIWFFLFLSLVPFSPHKLHPAAMVADLLAAGWPFKIILCVCVYMHIRKL